MKILLIDQYIKENANYTLDLAYYLANDNDIYICSPSIIDSLNTNNKIKPFHLFDGFLIDNKVKKLISYVKDLKKLYKFIKREKFDIVHFQWFTLPWFDYHYVKKIKKITKLVITCHDITPFKVRFMEEKYLKKIYKQANKILVHGEKNTENFKTKYNIVDEVYSISSGLFCEKNFEILEKNISKSKLDIPTNKIVFSSIGKYRDSKGIEILIKAFGIVSKKYPSAFLLLAGDYKNVNSEFDKLISMNCNADNSKLAFNYIEFKDMPVYYAATDYAVLPYKVIFQSGALQTALFYHKAVILSNLENFNDGIQNNGFYFESKNVDDLALVMEKAILNYSNIKNYEQASIELARNRFDSNERVKQTKKHYLDLE